MLDVDRPAVTRAVGLVRAFRDDDEATFQGILATDYDDGATTAWQTFCAVVALADRALDSVEQLSGDDPETVRANFAAALLDVLDRGDETPGG